MVNPARLNEIGTRSKAGLFESLRRVRGTLLFALQAGVAAGLSWWIAHGLLGRPQPFFAPIAAVIVLNVSVGQKLRRGVELLVGVAVGILVGDAIIYVIGTGFIQIALVVSAAITAAALLDSSPTMIGQAASSAVLVATLVPPGTGIYFSRFVDAAIGGSVGLLVMILLLQVNPLTVVRKATGQALGTIADALAGTADALDRDDEEADASTLAALDKRAPVIRTFHDRLDEARETSRLAPVRWRTRAPLARYVDAAPHVERALHNARVLCRRALTLIREGEDVPPELTASMRAMAETIRLLGRELAAGREPVRAQELTAAAVTLAGMAYRKGVGFHGSVLVAQLRTIGTDVLLACGMKQKEAERVVRRAAARPSGKPGKGAPTPPRDTGSGVARPAPEVPATAAAGVPNGHPAGGPDAGTLAP